MDKDLKNYRPMTPKPSPVEEKLQSMRAALMDSDKCKQIAQKLSTYINNKK